MTATGLFLVRTWNCDRRTQNPTALLQDFDGYVKLAPQGPAAPQVRKLREQFVKYMEAQSKPNSADPPKP
jgi:hypothetical protein